MGPIQQIGLAAVWVKSSTIDPSPSSLRSPLPLPRDDLVNREEKPAADPDGTRRVAPVPEHVDGATGRVPSLRQLINCEQWRRPAAARCVNWLSALKLGW